MFARSDSAVDHVAAPEILECPETLFTLLLNRCKIIFATLVPNLAGGPALISTLIPLLQSRCSVFSRITKQCDFNPFGNSVRKLLLSTIYASCLLSINSADATILLKGIAILSNRVPRG
eukprot:3902523-Amphidinium_carterae.1